MLVVYVFSFSGSAGAHSGRTDSRGGHNCNVAPCAGTYHFHNSGNSSMNVDHEKLKQALERMAKEREEESSTIFESPWFWIIGIGGGIWIINKRSK